MREVRISSLADIQTLKSELETDSLVLVVDSAVPDLELAALVVRLHRRVQGVRHSRRIPYSCHLAIVCRQYGINITS